MAEKTNVERLADMFGGMMYLAEAVGKHPSVVTRWNQPPPVGHSGRTWNNGRVPTAYNNTIRHAAANLARLHPDRAAEIAETVESCLDIPRCPTCGTEMAEGRML